MSVPSSISYPIFKAGSNIILDIFGGSKSKSKTTSITYDSAKTTMTGAKLSVSATADLGFTDYIIDFNGEQVHRFDWPVYQGGTDVATIDVTPLKGENITTVTFEKPVTGATLTFIISLIVDFVGEEPKIVNPKFWEDWPTWWPYAAAGGGLAVVGLIILLTPKMQYQYQREPSGVQPIVIYANGRGKK